MNTYTTIAQVRDSFWIAHPEFSASYRVGKRQNAYNADIRTAFCDWLDMMNRDGQISDKLANRATL